MIFVSHACSPTLFMYGKALQSVSEYKYLGVTVLEGSRFTTATLKPLIRFRSSANSILNAQNRSSEPMLMKLLYTICVPHLTYASEAVGSTYTSKQLQSMNVALNDSIRRIFGYNRWESIRFLRLSFGYPSQTDIFHARSCKFFKKMRGIGNSTLIKLIDLSCH